MNLFNKIKHNKLVLDCLLEVVKYVAACGYLESILFWKMCIEFATFRLCSSIKETCGLTRSF